MYIWVYSPSTGEIRCVSAWDGDPEKFASEWCNYFKHDIYFFADLEPI